MKRLLTLCIIAMVSLTSLAANPPSARSVEFNYTQLYPDSSIYIIALKYSQRCDQGIVPPTQVTHKLKCASGLVQRNITMDRVSVRDVSSKCNNFDGCKTKKGIKEFIFHDTIDLSSPTYDSLLQCGEIIFYRSTSYTRSTTTNLSGCKYYTTSSFKIGTFKNNNSSYFNYDELAVNATVNQPFRSIIRFKDDDGDSLSFKITNLMTSNGAVCPYASTYSVNNPFDVTYPGGAKYPYNNPNANPPQGLYFNSETGDLIFTPTNADEIYDYNIECTEWRSDSNQVMQKVGVVNREMRLAVHTTSTDPPPVISELTSNHSSCIGEPDSTFFQISDFPLGSDSADDLAFYFECDYPVSIITTKNKRVKDSTIIRGCIKWDTDSFTSIPSKFDVILGAYQTKRCGGDKADRRRVTINLYPTPSISTKVYKLNCGVFTVQTDSDSFNQKPASKMYTVIDYAGNIILSKPSSLFNSTTFQIKKTGNYILETKAFHVKKCFTTVRDSIFVNKNEVYPIPTETDFLVCNQPSKRLSVDSKWAKALWDIGDSSHSIIVNQSGVYPVTLTDSCGYETNVQFNVNFRTVGFDLTDTSICFGDSAQYKIPILTHSSWDWPDSSTDSIWPTTGGQFEMTIYDSMCSLSFTDSFEVKTNFAPLQVLSSSLLQICDGDSIYITSDTAQHYNYSWNTGSKEGSIYASVAGSYSVNIWNECGMVYDTAILQVISAPTLQLRGDTSICEGDTLTISGNSINNVRYRWNTGDTLESIRIDKKGLYIVEVKNSCGDQQDSVQIGIIQPPMVNIGPDTTVNKGFSLTLSNRHTSDNPQRLWSSGDTTSSIIVDSAGLYWLKESNVCGYDSSARLISIFLSLDQITHPEIVLYPNPARSHIYLELNSSNHTVISIINALGQEVYNEEINQKYHEISVSDFSTGNYIINVLQGGKIYSTKLAVLPE